MVQIYPSLLLIWSSLSTSIERVECSLIKFLSLLTSHISLYILLLIYSQPVSIIFPPTTSTSSTYPRQGLTLIFIPPPYSMLDRKYLLPNTSVYLNRLLLVNFSSPLFTFGHLLSDLFNPSYSICHVIDSRQKWACHCPEKREQNGVCHTQAISILSPDVNPVFVTPVPETLHRSFPYTRPLGWVLYLLSHLVRNPFIPCF